MAATKMKLNRIIKCSAEKAAIGEKTKSSLPRKKYKNPSLIELNNPIIYPH